VGISTTRKELGSSLYQKPRRLWSHGFTLVEVLGAMLILVIFLFPLIGANVTGIRLEASAQRRTEAAQLANQIITELELEIGQGNASLEPGVVTGEDDYFQIESEISEYVVELPSVETDRPDEQETPGFDAGFGSDFERPNPIRLIQVRIFWEDNGKAHMVQRTTFAIESGMGMGMDPGMMAPGTDDPNSMMGAPGFNPAQSPEFPQ